MTEAEFQAEMQKANDMINLLSNQRTSAQNELVNVGAQYIAEQRKAAKVPALEEKIAELEAKVAELTQKDDPEAKVPGVSNLPSKPNGKHAAARA